MTPEGRRTCCYILRGGMKIGTACPLLARWEIWTPDDEVPEETYVDACNKHLPVLMTNAYEHRVFRIDHS